jgi:hypothetical protein
MIRIMKECGWTKQDMYRARKLAELSEEEVREIVDRRFRRGRLLKSKV